MDALYFARLWSRTSISSVDKCWPWKGFVDPDGYGELKVGGRAEKAHRVALTAVIGRLPENTVVMHSCDNRLCCNPMHLSAGDHLDNVRDRVLKDRSAKGEKNGRAKLDGEKVKAIRSDTRTLAEIAEAYGVSQATVSLVQRRKVWQHV